MKRDDIIKALELCVEWRSTEDCYKCPYYVYEGICECAEDDFLLKQALALINELTEENERLKAEKSAALDTFAERLKRYYNALNGRTPAVLVAYHIEQIKQEMLGRDRDDNT